jgi:hypothetical protein
MEVKMARCQCGSLSATATGDPQIIGAVIVKNANGEPDRRSAWAHIIGRSKSVWKGHGPSSLGRQNREAICDFRSVLLVGRHFTGSLMRFLNYAA